MGYCRNHCRRPTEPRETVVLGQGPQSSLHHQNFRSIALASVSWGVSAQCLLFSIMFPVQGNLGHFRVWILLSTKEWNSAGGKISLRQEWAPQLHIQMQCVQPWNYIHTTKRNGLSQSYSYICAYLFTHNSQVTGGGEFGKGWRGQEREKVIWYFVRVGGQPGPKIISWTSKEAWE